MAHYCNKCGTQTMLMSGTIYLRPDDEPYESGVYEGSREGFDDVEKHIIAHFCEKCDEITDTWNE